MDRARKCLKAVFRPDAFPAFSRVAGAEALERLWLAAPHAVLANLAHLAYHREPEIRAVLERLGAERVHVVNVKEAQAVLAEWPARRALLAFRGSATARDSLANADVRRVPDGADPGSRGGARVHRGFQGRLDLLWERHLVPLLGGLDLPAWVTGHSLGGAMALLAARRRAFEEVVTFGQPLVGRGLGGGERPTRHVRYHRRRDIVTMVPPRFLGYEHHGEAVELIDPDGPSWRYDHAIVYYAEVLERAVG